jgi:rare lipoprotein A
LRKLALATVVLLVATSSFAHARSWTGEASFYAARTHMGCAHRSLPFGTKLKVTNLANQRSVTLVVNDRGPFIKGRIVDVSTGAADTLGFRHAGVAPVRIETLAD